MSERAESRPWIPGVRSQKDAAREVGVDVKTIRDILAAHGVASVPGLPYNGFGIDEDGMSVIRRALNKAPVSQSA